MLTTSDLACLRYALNLNALMVERAGPFPNQGELDTLTGKLNVCLRPRDLQLTAGEAASARASVLAAAGYAALSPGAPVGGLRPPSPAEFRAAYATFDRLAELALN